MRSIEVHGPISRAQLGQQIAQQFARYVEVGSFCYHPHLCVTDSPPLLQKTQYEASSSSSWPIGPHGIKIENLVLISVWNSFDGNWQADVAVDF